MPLQFMLAVSVRFVPTDLALPHHRIGTLNLHTSDPGMPIVSRMLLADIDIGCDLTIAPNAWNFGNVIPNTSAHAARANASRSLPYADSSRFMLFR